MAGLIVNASAARMLRPTEGPISLDPIKGDNIEAGLKGAWFGGRFNASAAVFQARQDNTAEAAGYDTVLRRTIYRGVDATSQGIELESGGNPVEGLQVTGGFTTMRVRGNNDQAVRTFVPRNLTRLNVTYAPPALPALKLGASLQHQSRFYFEPGSNSVTTGQLNCSVGNDFVDVHIAGRTAASLKNVDWKLAIKFSVNHVSAGSQH